MTLPRNLIPTPAAMVTWVMPIRFILRNNRMASDDSLGGVAGRLYVRPASHAGGPSGPKESVPYGARLRLRSDFPLDG